MAGEDFPEIEGAWETVGLQSPSGELAASFVPQAGMVGWSLRHNGEELLAHSVSLSAYAQTGHPAGIPLLHPWANRLASHQYEIAGRQVDLTHVPRVHTDPNGLPIHGLLAGWPDWEIVQRKQSRLKVRLDFAAWPELMEGFPFPHLLELTIELADARMSIDTELIPTGDVAVPVAFGFHPYLRLPGVPREQWLIELPVSSRMKLDERMLPTGASEPVRIAPQPLGQLTFDDGFDGLTDPPEFAISSASRRLSLRFRAGYRFAQIYAPPGSDFICFEPMTAPANPFESERLLLAEPRSSYLARFEISVSG